MRLLGTEDGCFVRMDGSPSGGIVLVDQFGYAIVSSRPRLPLPYLRNILTEDGQPVKDAGGGFVEDLPPPFNSLVVSNCEGDLNRISGQKGHPQRLHWDGCKFVFVDESDALTLEDFDYVGQSTGYCGIYEVVLVRQPNGTVKMGYRAKPTLLAGVLMMWGGDKDVVTANGWIVCLGQALSKTEYPDLFGAWGYAWGGSDDTFYAPKPNGRLARFVDDGAGVDPDAASRTALQTGGNTGDHVGTYGKGTNSTSAAHDFGVYLIAFAGCIVSTP